MEGDSSRSLLCHLTSLLLLQLPMWVSSDKFLVIGPAVPIVAMLGGNTMLPCLLAPGMNAENMELRWFRSKPSEAVFIYQNQQEQKEGQMPQYAGRTSLVRDFLTQGQAAVRIDNVQVSDDGLYTCFFKNGEFYDMATLEVKVAGLGSVPEVLMKQQEEDGVRVACRSSSWFPKPQAQWRQSNGEKFLTFSEDYALDSDGLFHVETSLVVRDSSAGNVTCSIFNPILGQEKVKTISIPESFFPKASPWKAAFAVSVSVLMLLTFGAGCFLKKEHSAMVQAQQENKHLHLGVEKDRQNTKEALKAKDELQAVLNKRNEVQQDAWKRAQQNLDWLKNHFQALSVTLDPCSAHQKLALSQENTSLTIEKRYVSANVDTCSALGCEVITSGQCYWEVEVKNEKKGIWALGVCRKDVTRTTYILESPENGFWVVKWYIDKFLVCTTSRLRVTVWEFPSRVGVFLDYDNGNVSLFNLVDGMHIFSFSSVSFTGPLLPYFMVGSGDTSLTICSATGGTEGLSVDLNKSSCKESTRVPGEVLNTGSGGDGAPPGAESPLLPCDPETVPPQGPSTVSVPQGVSFFSYRLLEVKFLR